MWDRAYWKQLEVRSPKYPYLLRVGGDPLCSRGSCPMWRPPGAANNYKSRVFQWPVHVWGLIHHNTEEAFIVVAATGAHDKKLTLYTPYKGCIGIRVGAYNGWSPQWLCKLPRSSKLLRNLYVNPSVLYSVCLKKVPQDRNVAEWWLLCA